jgi:hypothetical protein
MSTDAPRNSESDPQVRVRKQATPQQQNDDPCPYYYDAKLELKMYRGRGFKQFHPVLGSVAGHKEICDEWDAKQQLNRTNSNGQASIAFRPRKSTADTESTVADIHNQNDGTPVSDGRSASHLTRNQEQHCLEQVLMVFPQVQHDFVRKLLRERHPGNDGSPVESQAADVHVPGAVIAEIAEMQSYPKQNILKRKHSPTARDTEDVTIKWNRDVLKNGTYFKEALILLADEFTRIPTHFIHKMLREKGALYGTFHFLAEHEKTYNNRPQKPYVRSRLGRSALEKKYQRTAAEQREGHQYISVVNELQAARQQLHREETRQKRQRADEAAEANNFTTHQLQGSLIECQCCFNDAPINRVVHCENDEMHFFCNKCIEARAKEQIGSLKHEMQCMDISGCAAELSREALAQALPVAISDKLAEIQQLAEIKAAGLDGLEQCPFCEYQAICLSVDIDAIFECLNPGCEKVSCRRCNEESHVPRSCEEAKKDKGLSARHAVEEARSEAMMRTCPKCRVKIVKSAGCNKMACSNCRAIMCYVCKQDITLSKYEHFGTGATRCPIQDQSAEDRHQQEADDAEKAAIAAAKARDANINEEDLRIEAHLNQRPVRAMEMGLHGDLHRPPAGLQVPDMPRLPLMGAGPGHLLIGLQRAEPQIAEHAVDNFHHLLQEAHQQHDRVRRMLEDRHEQLRGLQPLIPTPAAPPMPPLPRLGHGIVPPIRQADQYVQYAYPRRAANAAPTEAPWNLNGQANTRLAARAHGGLHQDLLWLQRQAVQNNYNALLGRGDGLRAQDPQPFLQDDLLNPFLWAREADDFPDFPDLPDFRDFGFPLARQQQNPA